MIILDTRRGLPIEAQSDDGLVTYWTFSGQYRLTCNTTKREIFRGTYPNADGFFGDESETVPEHIWSAAIKVMDEVNAVLNAAEEAERQARDKAYWDYWLSPAGQLRSKIATAMDDPNSDL